MSSPALTMSCDPIIFHIGDTAIGWYGVFMLLAIITATAIVLRQGPRYGISRDFIIGAAFWIVLAGLIGARLTHVLDNLHIYSQNPAQILAFWTGGLGWYGGLLGGLLAGSLYAWKNKVSVGRFADIGGLGALVGLSIGRLGCTVHGCCPGTPTDLPWGLVYTHPNVLADLHVAGHPAPLYEIIWNLLLFGILWKLKDRLRPQGGVFLAMVAAYTFGRFWISWVRAEPAILGPLHQSHVISIVLFLAAAALMVYFKAGLKAPPSSEQGTGPGQETAAKDGDRHGQ